MNLFLFILLFMGFIVFTSAQISNETQNMLDDVTTSLSPYFAVTNWFLYTFVMTAIEKSPGFNASMKLNSAHILVHIGCYRFAE